MNDETQVPSTASLVEQWFRRYHAVLMHVCRDRWSSDDALQTLWLGVLTRPPPGEIVDDGELPRRIADARGWESGVLTTFQGFTITETKTTVVAVTVK